MRSWIVVLAAAVFAGCSGEAGGDSAGPSTKVVSPSDDDSTAAEDVVAAFAVAGLPVPNPRSDACGLPKCEQLITTDAISVYVFNTPAAAAAFVNSAEELDPHGAFRQGRVVLSYLAARTPAADRPRYEAVLAKL